MCEATPIRVDGLGAAVLPLIEQLRASGHRLGQTAIAEALRAAGE